MAKVLVLGGSGFLGSHVADHLTNLNYEVSIYDQIESKWLKSSQTMIIGNLLDYKNLNKILSGFDYVYNFAAKADLNDTLRKPIETIETNILGNMNVLKACHENKIKRFIYGSTVYVNSSAGGFYRCSKQAAENYIEEFYKQFGLEFTILRSPALPVGSILLVVVPPTF